MRENGLLDIDYMIESVPRIASGVFRFPFHCGSGIFFGMMLGFGIALCKVYRVPVLQRICQVYVSFIR